MVTPVRSYKGDKGDVRKKVYSFARAVRRRAHGAEGREHGAERIAETDRRKDRKVGKDRDPQITQITRIKRKGQRTEDGGQKAEVRGNPGEMWLDGEATRVASFSEGLIGILL